MSKKLKKRLLPDETVTASILIDISLSLSLTREGEEYWREVKDKIFDNNELSLPMSEVLMLALGEQ